MNSSEEYTDPLFFQQKNKEHHSEKTFDIPDPETVLFPPKPRVISGNSKEKSIQSTLISAIGFILLFHFVFDWAFIDIIILTGVIFIHELGHFFAMKTFNYSNLKIFFIPLLGALTSGSKKITSQKQEAIVLLAGPVPGIIIGGALLFVAKNTNNNLISSAASIFIFINIFNLLPVIPLDGGRLINTLFFNSNTKIKKTFVIISIIMLSSYALFTKSYMLIIISVLLLVSLKNDSKNNAFKALLTSKFFNTNKDYDEVSNKEYWLIRDQLALSESSYLKYITPGKYEYSENEQIIFKRIEAILTRAPLEDLSVAQKILFSLLWLVAILLPLIIILNR